MSQNKQGNSPSDVSLAKRLVLRALALASSIQAAFQNRKVASPETLVAPFTPPTSPNTQLIAAALVTPKSSGIFQLIAQLQVENGANADTYEIAAGAFSGTNLVVGGGSVTSGGWTMGSTVPPTVTGTGITEVTAFSGDEETIPATAFTLMSIVGINPTPLPLGVPSVVEIIMASSGGHTLAGVEFLNIAIVELP